MFEDSSFKLIDVTQFGGRVYLGLCAVLTGIRVSRCMCMLITVRGTHVSVKDFRDYQLFLNLFSKSTVVLPTLIRYIDKVPISLYCQSDI